MKNGDFFSLFMLTVQHTDVPIGATTRGKVRPRALMSKVQLRAGVSSISCTGVWRLDLGFEGSDWQGQHFPEYQHAMLFQYELEAQAWYDMRLLPAYPLSMVDSASTRLAELQDTVADLEYDTDYNSEGADPALSEAQYTERRTAVQRTLAAALQLATDARAAEEEDTAALVVHAGIACDGKCCKHNEVNLLGDMYVCELCDERYCAVCYQFHPRDHVLHLYRVPAKESSTEPATWQVERLLKKRYRGRSGREHAEYLVRWAGFSPESDTWEPESNLPRSEVSEFNSRMRPNRRRRSPSSTPPPVESELEPTSSGRSRRAPAWLAECPAPFHDFLSVFFIFLSIFFICFCVCLLAH